MSSEPAARSGFEELLSTAERVLPGGTFGNTAADVVIREGRGSRVWDEGGREYIDYLIGSGPMLVGHSHPRVLDAVRAQLELGTTFFANNRPGIELAAAIAQAVPCADKVRFVSTGSEADAVAMRVARAYTGREKVLKFEGGYHGYSDYGLMSLAPKRTGNSPHPIPDSAGIPRVVQDTMLVAQFNDVDGVAALVREHGDDIACVFMEPMQRLIPPRPGFLAAVRELTEAHDILLVFDEVVTGFRLGYGGAQAHYGVTPDLCTLGKAIGGGFPLAAVAGREEVMAVFDAERAGAGRFVPLVGTLSGNPMAAAAGNATLAVLREPGCYERLFAVGRRLVEGIGEALARHRVEAQVVGEPALFDVVFASGEIRDYRDTLRADAGRLGTLNGLLRERGVLKSENKNYLSTSLTDVDVEETLAAWDGALGTLGR